MSTGVFIAILVVIVVVAAFFLIDVFPDPLPASGGEVLPPNPGLLGFIKAAQTASAAVVSLTSNLESTLDDLTTEVNTTFANYGKKQGVKTSTLVGLQKQMVETVSTAQRHFRAYAQKLASFNRKVQSWSANSKASTIMQEKPAVVAMQFDITEPMASFVNISGQISSLVSSWNAAYEAASEGKACSHGSDCKKHQSCVKGRCAVKMDKTMQGAIAVLESAAESLKTNGDLNKSPWRQAAIDASRQYMALFNHIAGV
ncbi:hypothetical protein ElyMa_002533800 [Elysia marginata]|uniref:Uncharacterized protein n=1 Tax=Elysia marginata TaxID=1093978 RepID=A0AAV4GUT4_9GAST|nr:hypothetical protein ElyMa_002533800 [Elysia marginata]